MRYLETFINELDIRLWNIIYIWVVSHNKRAQWIFHFLNVLKDWSTLFMPPAWKVHLGHLVFGLSVRYSLLFRPAYKQSAIFNVWMVSNQTWTASSPKGCLHLNDITCPLGDGRGQNVDFAIFCSPGHPCFTHMSSFVCVGKWKDTGQM